MVGGCASMSEGGGVDASSRAAAPAGGVDPGQIKTLSERYGIHDSPDSFHYHFPRRSFLEFGYHPPGGYVKDFCVVGKDGRWHVFHIDGRPGQICWITGNEISFGHASTGDFQHWVRHRMPLAVSDRPWENQHIWAPYIIAFDDRYHMFYMGAGTQGAFITRAVSADLERWDRAGTEPIRRAAGRDPFVFEHQGRMILVYTASRVDEGMGRLGACASSDLTIWEPLPPILLNPNGPPESASIHPSGDGYVLWFNDWGDNGNFRAAYAHSNDPLCFGAGDVRSFAFVCGPDDVPDDPAFRRPHRIVRPVPTSIELIATGPRLWLVAYFRVVGNGFRLFFGQLDWTTRPATIREIDTQAELDATLAAVNLPASDSMP